MIFHDLTLSDEDFRQLAAFLQTNYGIDLSKKKQLISGRLSGALKQRGYRDFHAFLQHFFTTKDPEDLELVLNKLTTNYTFFLREKEHFTCF